MPKRMRCNNLGKLRVIISARSPPIRRPTHDRLPSGWSHNLGTLVQDTAKHSELRTAIFTKCILQPLSIMVDSGDTECADFKDNKELAAAFVDAWPKSNNEVASDLSAVLNFIATDMSEASVFISASAALDRLTTNKRDPLAKCLFRAEPAANNSKTRVTVGHLMRSSTLSLVSTWSKDNGYESDIRSAIIKAARIGKHDPKTIIADCARPSPAPIWRCTRSHGHAPPHEVMGFKETNQT